MLGLFKRKTFHDVSALTQRMALLTHCQRIQPLTLAQYEQAEQSLESFYDWLFDFSNIKAPIYAGHYAVDDKCREHFAQKLESLVSQQHLPIVVSNTHEGVLSLLPEFVGQNRDIGIVSVGPSFQLKPALNLELGSAFHFALSRYNECRLMCLGIDDSTQDIKTFEYAEDLGCNWLLQRECDFRHRQQLKHQLTTYLSRCDDIIVDIDLSSLSKSVDWESDKKLDVDMVIRMIAHCLESKKVRAIQLTGLRDKDWYSKYTKQILDELCTRLSRNDSE
ncbi:arginase [Vibrio olivae]|uniref:Arginase n=1 Tax=Vibrio olivae TaxID=1243002 RepID=A0ABV5HNL0_9VIBR